jgi:hypothetical protein
MRWIASVVVVAALGASCIWPAGAGDQPAAAAVLPQPPQQSLIGLSFPASDKVQQVTVIDPQRRAMSVYHIDATTGAIELKSVRRIEWDLEMIQFNGVEPLPREIRSLIEQRR